MRLLKSEFSHQTRTEINPRERSADVSAQRAELLARGSKKQKLFDLVVLRKQFKVINTLVGQS